MEQNTQRVPFFEGSRREISLHQLSLKRNTENEKRLRMDIRLTLDGGKIVGFPAFIFEAFDAMSKQPIMKDCYFDQQIEGMNIDFFPQDQKAEPEFTLRGCTLRDFSIIRVKDGEDGSLVLCFNTTVPRNLKLLKWADEYDGQTLWAKFSEGQMSIPAPDAQMSLTGEAEKPNGVIKVDKGARASAKRASEARA